MRTDNSVLKYLVTIKTQMESCLDGCKNSNTITLLWNTFLESKIVWQMASVATQKYTLTPWTQKWRKLKLNMLKYPACKISTERIVREWLST